jgi:SAM-dependent methyltransferase
MDAMREWARELRAWRIPDEILSAAPRDPYAFPGSTIRTASVDPLDSPTGRAVLERLNPGDRLLDIGCGAGRISGPFTALQEVVGIEPRPNLAAISRESGIDVIEGKWPQVAGAAGTAPVVLSTHVMYDVQDPQPFLRAMVAAAQRRIVIEVTERHPWHDVGRLYRIVHGIDRPEGPTGELLGQVVEAATGMTPQVVRWTRPGSTYPDADTLIDHEFRMLCIGPDHPKAEEVATLAMADVELLADRRVRRQPVQQCTLWADV